MIVLHAHYSSHFTQFLPPTASFLGDKINGIWIYQYASVKRECNLPTCGSMKLNSACVPLEEA